MSICTVSIAMDRIKSARKKSPIAIFRCAEENMIEAIFGDSITTRQRLEHDKTFVWMFDGSMDLDCVAAKLNEVELV